MYRLQREEATTSGVQLVKVQAYYVMFRINQTRYIIINTASPLQSSGDMHICRRSRKRLVCTQLPAALGVCAVQCYVNMTK